MIPSNKCSRTVPLSVWARGQIDPGSSIIAASAWSMSNISCIRASNHSSSMASSSEASRHGGATGTTVIVTGSEVLRQQSPIRTSQFHHLQVENQNHPSNTTPQLQSVLVDDGPPTCHPALPNLQPPAYKGRVPNVGARFESQGTKTKSCRLPDEQTYLADNRKKSGPSRGLAPSSDWDIGGLPSPWRSTC